MPQSSLEQQIKDALQRIKDDYANQLEEVSERLRRANCRNERLENVVYGLVLILAGCVVTGIFIYRMRGW